MSISKIISSALGFFMSMSKKKLVEVIDQLRECYKDLFAENIALKEELAALKK